MVKFGDYSLLCFVWGTSLFTTPVHLCTFSEGLPALLVNQLEPEAGPVFTCVVTSAQRVRLRSAWGSSPHPVTCLSILPIAQE